MRSYQDLGIASPKAYVRLMDLYTGEKLSIAQDTLLSVNVSRSIGSSGTASLSFANGDGKWRDARGLVTPKEEGKYWTPQDRLDIWDIMSYTPWKVTNFKAAQAGSKLPGGLVALRSRVPVSIAATGASSNESQVAQFMRAIFTGDPCFRDANDERMARYNEFVSKLGRQEAIEAEDLQRFLRANLYVMLRTRLEVDFTDFRGYVFPAFTGYVSDIDDSTVTGGLSLLNLTCKDWMEAWKETIMVSRSAWLLVEQLQQEVAQIPQSNKSMSYDSVLANLTPDETLNELVKIVNGANTLSGFVEAVGHEGAAVRRNKEYPVLWETVQELQVDKFKIRPKFIHTEKLWDEVLPYTVGVPMFDSPKASSVPVKSGFRVARAAFFDANFSKLYGRKFAPLAMQTLMRHSIELFQHQTTHPFEQFSPVVQRTFADFFVASTGDIVFKLPYLNHLPSVDSPWDLPSTADSAWKILDSGYGRMQLPEAFHGVEYVMGPYGRVNPSFSYSDQGKFTRVKASYDMNFIKLGNQLLNVGLKDGYQTAPLEMQAFFGAREFTVSNTLSSFTDVSTKWYAGALLPMMNWKNNMYSVQYNKVLPWELGKNVYVPERNWLYRLSGIVYNWQKGASFTANLTGDYGHPATVLLPIPWMVLYNGTKTKYDPTDALRYEVQSKASWAANYKVGVEILREKFPNYSDLPSEEYRDEDEDKREAEQTAKIKEQFNTKEK